MIIGFSHFAIVVDDLKKAETFYGTMFNMKKIDTIKWSAPNDEYDQGVGLEGSAATAAVMSLPNCYVELWQYDSPEVINSGIKRNANDVGISHLGFEVDDVHAELERLVELGGEMINPPRKYPKGQNAIYARDPFGNIIELLEAGPHFQSLHEVDMIKQQYSYE